MTFAQTCPDCHATLINGECICGYKHRNIKPCLGCSSGKDAEIKRLRDALEKAHYELARAQLGDEYEPNVDVLNLVEQAIAATAQQKANEPPKHPCVECGDYLESSSGDRGIPHPCEYCAKNIEHYQKNGFPLPRTVPATAQGGKE